MFSIGNIHAQLQIPILTEKNYEIWSIKMRSLLQCEGVWDVVAAGVGEAAAPAGVGDDAAAAADKLKNDKTALCLIHHGLDNNVILKISAAGSSKQAWDILKDIYNKDTNEFGMNNNAVASLANLPAEVFVAVSAGFVLRLLFGDFLSDSGMLSFVIIQVSGLVLLMYVIYKIAAIKITNEEFTAMAIGAVIEMIVAISGPLSGASMKTARTIGAVAGSSLSIYMILGAVLGAIYYDVIRKP